MSIKRGSSGGGAGSLGPRRGIDESTAKIDRQDFWDDLQARAETNDTFSPTDVAQSIGAPEAAVSKHLLTLAFERLLERVEGGRYRAGPLKGTSHADFVKAMTSRVDPKRQQDQLEIERLKNNNNEMRRRLMEAVADRDRYVALLKKHNIDPAEAEPRAIPVAAAPAPAAVEALAGAPVDAPVEASADEPTNGT